MSLSYTAVGDCLWKVVIQQRSNQWSAERSGQNTPTSPAIGFITAETCGNPKTDHHTTEDGHINKVMVDTFDLNMSFVKTEKNGNKLSYLSAS